MEFYFKIEKNNEYVSGILTNINSYKFNPLTALGDLIHLTRNPLLFNKQAIRELQTIFKISYKFDEQECLDYYLKMCDLRTHIQCDTLFTYNEFEKLKSFYGLTFEVDINTFIKHKKGHLSIPIKFGHCSVDKALEISSKEEYFYKCHSMIDISFAILHFLLRNDYKFKRCEHCGKYFATHTFKQKYCTRKSPLNIKKDHKYLTCGEAVDNRMGDLRKRKATIYSNIEEHHNEVLNDFVDEFELFGGVKSEKRAEDLEALTIATDKEHRKRWYSKKKK